MKDRILKTQSKKEIYKVTVLGSLGNAFLCAFKFIAGILGNSSAMIADAVHSLSDFVTDVIVLVFVKISSKPCDAEHQYGHGKYETLATAVVGLILFFVGIGILYEGSVKIWHYLHGDTLEEPRMIALVAALLSIAIKEALYHLTVHTGRKYNSPVVVANAWHHRSDSFSSIGTALGIAGAMFFGVKGRVLDPLAAVIVSFFIMKVSVQLVKPCIDELVERSLPPQTEAEILKTISGYPEVHSPHNLRTRRIGSYSAVDVHVRMRPDMTVLESHQVTRDIEQSIRDQLGQDTYVTIHVEPLKQNLREN